MADRAARDANLQVVTHRVGAGQLYWTLSSVKGGCNETEPRMIYLMLIAMVMF